MGGDIGENIRRARKEQGLTQIQLSKRSGVSQSAISDIENPTMTKQPNTDTIQKIANALNCSVDTLLGNITEKPIAEGDEPNMGSVGDRIRSRRKDDHISQIELSKTAGISQSTLSAIETGAQNPSVSTIQAIAEALKCPLSDLMDEKKPIAKGDELREQILDMVSNLSDEEVQRVLDFSAGIKASRKG